jgi:hypothetical protein
MSYVGYEGLGAAADDARGYASALGQQLYGEARDQAKAQGVPNEIFDTYSNVAQGALTQDAATLRNNFLASTMQMGQKYGAQAISNATGIPVGPVSNIIGGVMSGGGINPSDVAAVAGGVAGLVICGPPCAAIGAVVGTLIVSVVSGVVDGLKDLFGANNAERAAHERALRAARDALQNAVVDRMNEYTATYFFSVANIYNRMLLIPNGFGVDDTMVMPSKVTGKIPVVQNALASVRGDRYLYRQQHNDQQPEQVVLLPSRQNFATDVYGAVQKNFGNIAVRGADESGYNALRKMAGIVSGVGQVPASMLPLRADGKTPVFCQFAQIGRPDCDGSGAPLGAFGATGTVTGTVVVSSGRTQPTPEQQAAQRKAACSPTELMISLWQCNADENRPGFLQWYHDSMDYVASNWMAIAARDCAVIAYQQKVKAAGQDMIKTIQDVANKSYVSEGAKQLAIITAQANATQAIVKQNVAQTTALRATTQKGFTAKQKQALAIGAAGLGIGAAIVILA